MDRTGGPLFVKGEGAYGQGAGPDEVLNHNGSDPDQPGLWCQWIPSDDGTEIMWDDGEKFYYSAEWMAYIVRLLSDKAYIQAHINEDPRLKNFTCDHKVNGEIYCDGEESDDNWKIKVTDNVVETIEAKTIYGDEEPEVPPVSEAELRAALQSLGAEVKARVRVWTLTTDADEIATTVHGTEEDAFKTLQENFDPEGKFDVSTTQGCGDLIEELTERQGVVLYIEEHEVEVAL